MSEIRKQSDVSEIAAIVSAALEKAGITAVLSGGAAVSIYTKNAYVSLDLDFVSSESLDRIEPVLAELGFKRGQGRFFTHEDTVYVVEFPSGPVSFGGDVVREWGRIETAAGAIQIVMVRADPVRHGPIGSVLSLERPASPRPGLYH